MQEVVTTSKIIKIHGASDALRTTIPPAVRDSLSLKGGDIIEWHLSGSEGAYFYKVLKQRVSKK